MKSWLCAVLSLLCIQCYASPKDQALRHLQRAVTRTRPYKTAVKKLEKQVLTLLPVDKSSLTYLAPVAAALQGRIDTSALGRLRVPVLDGNILPVLRWDMRKGQFDTSVQLILPF